MDVLIQEINELLKKCKIQKHTNISYNISAPDDIKCILKQHYKTSSIEPSTSITITCSPLKITCVNPTIYLYGVYTKLSRNMSQTPHLNYKSVSDFTTDIKKFYNSDDVIFIGNGREDVNVVCYGRSYILDIINPKQNIHEIYAEMGLTKVEKKFRTEFVNKRSTKVYRALVYSNHWDPSFLDYLKCILETEVCDLKKVYIDEIEGDPEIENVGKEGTKFFVGRNNILQTKYFDDILKCIKNNGGIQLKLKQKTPIRVMHRRPNLLRERSVEVLRARKIFDTYEFIIRADAGTYIKEFINGDFGRTTVSLSSLNNSYCDCVELDVIKIED